MGKQEVIQKEGIRLQWDGSRILVGNAILRVALEHPLPLNAQLE
jgi:hypothetical protein